jgi:hypothetical protein
MGSFVMEGDSVGAIWLGRKVYFADKWLDQTQIRGEEKVRVAR